MRKIARVLAAGLLAAGAVSVGVGVAGAQDDALTFAMVSHGGVSNPFWIVVIKGMEDACTLLDANCQWLSEPDYGLEQMAGYWDDALALNPAGVGTTVPDAEVIRSGVERAAELDIPVIVFNTADPGAGTDSALPTLFYIGANEFTGGISNAQRVFAEAAAAGTSVTRGVCTIQEQGHSGLEARCAGVESVFDEMGVPIDRLNITNNPEETAGILSDYFAANADTNAIFMLGPAPSSGLNLYLQESGREAGSLFATSHDTSAEIYQMIQDGYLLQTIDQQPYLQGFQTIMWLYLNSQFEMAPGGDIFTGPGVIDGSNVAAIIDLTAGGYR
ncbi:MAG: substrate-binding domain-containing protein [Pleurocapsa minor GSE-CHR-MK-17-07R]|jgi:simple sugar transport system substrate-binding protein|nr:substrate-binding domain-containing protein [Pleurocapsa minor GSE-CHR-MK 17-07R]